MTSYILEPEAYCKMIAHSRKHAACQVNGILLGRISEPHAAAESVVDPDSSEDKNSASKKVVEVRLIDAIPLFHNATLVPMLDVALNLIDQRAQALQLEVLGYYHVPANVLATTTPPPLAKQIVRKLHSNNKRSCLVMLDNEGINGASAEKKLCTKIFVAASSSGEQWLPYNGSDPDDDDKAIDRSRLQNLLNDVGNKHFVENLIDFDEHLENVALDFFNPTFFAQRK